MIELKNISCGYGKSTVLDGVSVSFEKGKLTCVIGVNGCGKSTLLKAVLGILPVSGGEVLIDKRSLADMTRNEIAKKVSYLAQGKSTPNMTVEQMVLHGRFPHLSYPRRYSAKDREIACRAMEQVGIEKAANDSLHTLSGGMRQNAYIAMALAQNTDYILLDEPTVYLDIAHQLKLMKLLRSFADQGKGIISVMHDLPMALTFSDRIIVLNDKKVAADDAPKKVCESGIAERVFGISPEYSESKECYYITVSPK